MRKHLRTIAAVAAALAGGALFAAPAAAATTTGPHCHRVHQQSSGNFGLLNGTQVYAPIDLGLDVTGNAIALLGGASTRSTSGDTRYDIHCGN